MDSSSGIIRVKQGHSPEISMHIKSIADEDVEDANYKLLTDFSCAKDEVKTDIPLLSIVAGRHSAEPVEEDYMIAKGDARSMYIDKLPGGGKGEIEAISVKKSGLAGTDDEVGYLYPGDFKYNIKLEYDEISDQETGAFVYLQVEYRIKNATVTKVDGSGSVYYLVEGSLVEESNLILHVPNKYYVFDETSSTMKERTMEKGYPKLSVSPDDKNVKFFIFQFAKAKQVFYDPTSYELPSYSKMNGGKTTVKKRGFNIKVQIETAEWLCGIITGIAGLASLFGVAEAQNRNFETIGKSIKSLKHTDSKKEKLDDGTWITFVISEKSSNTEVGFFVGLFRRSKSNIEYVAYEMKHDNPKGEVVLEDLMHNRLANETIETFYNRHKTDGYNPDTPMMAAHREHKKLKSEIELAQLKIENRALEKEKARLDSINSNAEAEETNDSPGPEVLQAGNGNSNGQDPANHSPVRVYEDDDKSETFCECQGCVIS